MPSIFSFSPPFTGCPTTSKKVSFRTNLAQWRDEIRNPINGSFIVANNFNLLWIPARVSRFAKAHDKSRDLAGMMIYGIACLAYVKWFHDFELGNSH
jgi:hypothetical protein